MSGTVSGLAWLYVRKLSLSRKAQTPDFEAWAEARMGCMTNKIPAKASYRDDSAKGGTHEETGEWK